MFTINFFSEEVTIAAFDQEYKKFQNEIMKRILQYNKIDMLRHVLEKRIFGLGFNTNTLTEIRSIQAFETFSEFGVDLGSRITNMWVIRELFLNQHPYLPNERFDLIQYVFSKYELGLLRKFDMEGYKYVTSCELGNDYREPRSFTRLFLKYGAGRDIRIGRIIDWTSVKTCLFKTDDGEYEYYNLRYKETNKRGKNGREYKLTKGLVYSFSICAVVMFGAKIKTGKRELCMRLHTFLVGGITT